MTASQCVAPKYSMAPLVRLVMVMLVPSVQSQRNVQWSQPPRTLNDSGCGTEAACKRHHCAASHVMLCAHMHGVGVDEVGHGGVVAA